MASIYIGIILCCRVLQHLCNKRASMQITGTACFVKYSAYRQLLSAACGLLLIAVGGKGMQWNLLTVLISTLSGITLIASMGFSMAALKAGTVALTALFGTAGILVPCIAGIFLFQEPMSLGQWFGIVLFFVAAYFLITSSSKIYCKITLKSIFLLIGVMLANGGTMLAQQMFTFYVPGGSVSTFSFLSFGIVGIVMLVLSGVLPRTEGENSKLSIHLIGYGAILSAAVFVINQLATILTAMVSPAVLFTFINGGSTVIGAIVAAVFFREKLTFRSIVGVTLGVISLVIIKVM